MGFGGLHKGIELHRMHTPKHLAYQVDAALFIEAVQDKDLRAFTYDAFLPER
jgi:hypothetical protein